MDNKTMFKTIGEYDYTKYLVYSDPPFRKIGANTYRGFYESINVDADNAFYNSKFNKTLVPVNNETDTNAILMIFPNNIWENAGINNDNVYSLINLLKKLGDGKKQANLGTNKCFTFDFAVGFYGQDTWVGQEYNNGSIVVKFEGLNYEDCFDICQIICSKYDLPEVFIKHPSKLMLERFSAVKHPENAVYFEMGEPLSKIIARFK